MPFFSIEPLRILVESRIKKVDDINIEQMIGVDNHNTCLILCKKENKALKARIDELEKKLISLIEASKEEESE